MRPAARLTHPHILPLYDSAEADGLLFFVMPVMEGQTLRTLLDAEGRLPVEIATRIASEVADALLRAERGDAAAAHALVDGLDLSPFDQHLTFHFAEVFAVLGDLDRALEVMALAVRKGFFPVPFFRTHCRFVEPLRAHPGFEDVVQDAERRSAEVRRLVAGTLSA